MQMHKGSNGVPVGDNGEYWRAFGSSNVTSPQIYDYMSRDDRPTGVKYGMGFDKTVGGTRIAFVDYPKTMYTLEEVCDGEDTLSILTRCNVCSAMDQAAKRSAGVRPYEQPIQHEQPAQISERISAGNMVAASLPKYMSFAIKAAKSLALRPAGDAAVSIGLSFLSDLAAGIIKDPEYKRALFAFSDEMIDSLDPNIIERVKNDAIEIAEAAYKDGDALLSKRMVIGAMFKTKGDLKKEVTASMAARNVTPGQVRNVSPSPIMFNDNINRHGVPRLFE